jgi:HD-GYP domain-containing protein (c-di-GMP phosphodiesterase class II)
MKTMERLKDLTALGWLSNAATILLVLIIVWATSNRVSQELEQAVAQGTASNTNQVNADEVRIRRTIATLDNVLVLIRQDIQDKRAFSRQELVDRVKQLSVSDDLDPKMAIVDANGVLLLTTTEPVFDENSEAKESHAINLADRDYFKHQLDNTSDELWIGVPIQSRVSGSLILPFSRRINNRDGSFGGVMTMSVNPEVFSSVYDKTEMGENGSLALIGLDGFTRIRKNGKSISYGEDVRSSQVFKEIQKSPAGTYTALAASDGVLRTTSYQVIAPYGLVVVAGRSVDAIHQSVSARINILWATGALLSVLLALLLRLQAISLQRATLRVQQMRMHATVLAQSYRDAIWMLGQAGHYNDRDTGSHIWRMAAYARALAVACGWDEDSSALLELAAPMHDTGKLGVPQAILRKAGALDAQEWVTMRTHPQVGFDILSKSNAPVFKLAAEVSLGHHEKWNGSGYPAGLKGKDIPQSARIVALADVFDALSMKRPYKAAWPLEKIMAHLAASSGTHFDPELVVIFSGILPQILAIRGRWDEEQAHSHGALEDAIAASGVTL